jgi:putative addiction module killer protein
VGYNHPVIEVRQTDEFRDWLRNLRDDEAAARIGSRLRRLEQGNPGDVKSLGAGLLEMRIDYGPGYRVYYVRHGAIVFVLLCGGDKRTQQRDIKRAQVLAAELKE